MKTKICRRAISACLTLAFLLAQMTIGTVPVFAASQGNIICSMVKCDDSTGYERKVYLLPQPITISFYPGIGSVYVREDTVVLPYREGLEVTVKDEGPGLGNPYTMINGKKVSLPTESEYAGVSSNGYPIYKIIYSIPSTLFDSATSELEFIVADSKQMANGTIQPMWHILDISFPDYRAPGPVVRFLYDEEIDKMRLEGPDRNMEYRLKSAISDTWKPCTNGTIFDIPDSSKTFYVRYSPTTIEAESKPETITLNPIPSEPSVTYSTVTEMIAGLTERMEIKFDDGPYTSVLAGTTTYDLSEKVDALADGKTLSVSIRTKVSATSPVGRAKVFTIYPRLSKKPSTVVYDKATISLTGVTTAMEYKVEPDSSWSAVRGTPVNLQTFASADRDIKGQIRYIATDTASASKSVEFTIPKLLEGPSGTIDYLNEKIVGLNDRIAYQYGTNGTSWSTANVKNGEFDLSGIITTANRTIYLRKATSVTAPFTHYTTFILPARNVSPSSPIFTYNEMGSNEKAVLTGVNSAMEYRISTETTWTSVLNTPVVLDIPASNVVYYVRVKSNGQSFASLNKSLTLYAKAAVPYVSYNTTTEMIALNSAMEMKFDNGAYTAIGAGVTTYDLSDKVDAIEAGKTLTVSIRTKATTTAPVSLDRVFTVYPRSVRPTTVAYDSATSSLTGVTSAMEYKMESDASWRAISGTTVNLQTFTSGDKDVKGQVRFKATSAASASKEVEFTIPKLAEGPTGTIDYVNEKIVGLDSSAAYQYGTNGTYWSAATIVNGTFDISNQITTSSKTLYLRKAATSTTPNTHYTIFTLPARPSAQIASDFMYNAEGSEGRAVLANVTEEMQYKRSTDAEWINGTGADIVLDVPATNVVYYVRVKSDGLRFASLNKSLTLYAKGSAPSASYNVATEIIALNNTMEIKFDDGAYTAIGAGVTTYDLSDKVDAIAAGKSLTVSIRRKATATAPTSLDRVITVYPRAAKPTSAVYNNATSSLTGVTSAMEYKIESDVSWRVISGTTVNLQTFTSGDKDVKGQVRFKATATASASKEVEFTIPKLSEGPSGTIDYVNEKIVGLDSSAAYQYGTNGTSWSTATTVNGTFDISNQIAASGKTLYLRKAATSTTPNTHYTIFTLPARPSAQITSAFVYNDEENVDKVILANVTSNMQYKKSTDAEWISGTGADIVLDVPATSVICYVRVKSDGQSFASLNRSLTLYAKGYAPSASYNVATEIIALNNTMEMKFDNGAYTAIEAGVTTYNLSDKVDAIATGKTVTVSIRTKATATAPASLDRVITVYPRSAKPTSAVYNIATSSLTGVTSAMEYKMESDVSWRAISGTTVNLQTFTSGDKDVKGQVRFKATATASASKEVEFTIPKLSEGPSGTIDYVNEKIVGLDSSATYQYGTNGTSWSTATIVNGTFDISNQITTSSRTLYLRKTATSTTPNTHYTIFTLPARPSAQITSAFVYNAEEGTEKVVLADVTDNMQYKKSTDAEWINGTGADIALDVPATNVVYYVRVKSNGQSFASLNKSLTLYAKAAVPYVSYNTTTEMIALNSAMEMKFDNDAYTAIGAGVTTYDLSDKVDAIEAGKTLTVSIRTKATATAPASLDRVITVYPRSVRPTTVAYDSASSSLTGVTSAMEYKMESDASWRAISGTTVNLQTFTSGDKDVKGQVRFKATTAASASKEVEFTIPKLSEGPTGTIDYVNEKIVGLDSSVAYQYGINGPYWYAATVVNGTFDISNQITTLSKSLYFRKAATSTTPNTNYTIFKLPARRNAPNIPPVVYNDVYNVDKAVLMNVASDMQYKKSTDTLWVDGTGGNIVFDIPDESATYYVRYKADEQGSFASLNKSLTLVERAPAPKCSYNETTEMISGLTSRMEIRFDDGEYTLIGDGVSTSSLSDLIDSLIPGESLTVSIRTKAIATAPASLDTVYTISARPEEMIMEEIEDLIPNESLSPEVDAELDETIEEQQNEKVESEDSDLDDSLNSELETSPDETIKEEQNEKAESEDSDLDNGLNSELEIVPDIIIKNDQRDEKGETQERRGAKYEIAV